MEKHEVEEIFEKIDNSKVLEVQVKDEIEKSFIAYAMAVNVSRAIPDVRDGLKPVHRRIIYSMGELNLFNDKPFKKCARIVGDVMGKYHPHGDSAIYDALVRLAQDFTINCPLVDGHGNFGSVDGDSPAASRYTEARLTKIAYEMLNGIDKETVDFYPNFDESEMQPVVLPSRFPNLLVNGSDGIAVGMATNVPPHNLNEVINGVVALINNPEITIDELMKHIPAPDFPTKGIILGGKGIKDMYETGKGSFVIRSKTDIEEFNNGTRSRIVITEIPYQVNKAKLIIQIADLVKTKKIEGISDIKEESDREGMRIVIDIKRDANAQVVLNSLFKHTQLQIGFGAIMLALVDGVPKVLNLKEILTHYLNFQKEVITRRTKFDLDKAEQKAHILRGLVIALANIDEVIRQIKLSDDKQDAINKLTTLFELTEKQATAILDMRLQKLTGLEVEKIKQDLAQTEEIIKELKSILESDDKILNIIKEDLIQIKENYGYARKSEISYDYSGIDIADLIEKEDVVISLTHGGYIKRMPTSEYHAQHRGGVGVTGHKTKEEDFVENIFITSTHDELLCFSSLGKVYTMMAYEVPESAKVAKGRAIVNLLQLDQNERITNIIPRSTADNGYLVIATKTGLIKKTDITEFDNIRKSGKIAIKLNDDDEVIGVSVSNGNNDILIASHSGKCIRFNEFDVRVMGRDTQGVKSIRLNDDDFVVDMVIVDEKCDMFTISENGYGKRSDQTEYRTQNRLGLGTKAGVFNEQTGALVNLKQVTDNDDIVMICSDGQVIRIKAVEVNKITRNTKGVRLMRLKNDAKVVSVDITPSIEEDEEDLQPIENNNTANISNNSFDNTNLNSSSLSDNLDLETNLGSDSLSDNLEDNSISNSLNDDDLI